MPKGMVFLDKLFLMSNKIKCCSIIKSHGKTIANYRMQMDEVKEIFINSFSEKL